MSGLAGWLAGRCPVEEKVIVLSRLGSLSAGGDGGVGVRNEQVLLHQIKYGIHERVGNPSSSTSSPPGLLVVGSLESRRKL